MKKIEVYGDVSPVDEPLRLKLVDSGSRISVTVVDAGGNSVWCGRLWSIHKETLKVVRNEAIDRDLGLPLNRTRQVKLHDE